MFSPIVSIFLGLTAVGVLLHLVGLWSMLRMTRRRPQIADPASLPPLTLLKPVKGLEDALGNNLRSLLSQDYPAPLQVVFCATDAADPGLALARRVAADHPGVEARFVISNADYGHNPKVSNMHGGLVHARHDLVLQTDANVRVPDGYLRRAVGELVAAEADMLGSLVIGRGERTLTAALENVQLTCFLAPGMCIAHEVAQIPCVVGKSMLFRRSALQAAGGLHAVKDLLAEDFMLARNFERAGKRVVMSASAVANVNRDTGLQAFCARHARWMKMRAVISVPGFVGDLCSNASFFALLAALAGGTDGRLWGIYAWAVAHKTACDALVLSRLRGQGLRARHLLASAGRDVLLGLIWGYALLSRTTTWRGQRLRLGADSRLTPVPPSPEALPARLLRRVGLR